MNYSSLRLISQLLTSRLPLIVNQLAALDAGYITVGTVDNCKDLAIKYLAGDLLSENHNPRRQISSFKLLVRLVAYGSTNRGTYEHVFG